MCFVCVFFLQAEEAAECERATADELLALLKEKEREVSQLRYDILQLACDVFYIYLCVVGRNAKHACLIFSTLWQSVQRGN